MSSQTSFDRFLSRGVLSRRRCESKKKEPSQGHSSRDKEPSEETTRYCYIAYPIDTCSNGRARPPP